MKDSKRTGWFPHHYGSIVWQGMAKPCHPSNSRRCCHLLYHIWETVASIVHKRCQTYILAALEILWMCVRVCFGQVHPQVLTVGATPLFLSATLLYISHSSPVNLVFRNQKWKKRTNSYKSLWPLKSSFFSCKLVCSEKTEKDWKSNKCFCPWNLVKSTHTYLMKLQIAFKIHLRFPRNTKSSMFSAKIVALNVHTFWQFFCDCSPSQTWLHPKFWH